MFSECLYDLDRQLLRSQPGQAVSEVVESLEEEMAGVFQKLGVVAEGVIPNTKNKIKKFKKSV
jgi:hypothetical protein